VVTRAQGVRRPRENAHQKRAHPRTAQALLRPLLPGPRRMAARVRSGEALQSRPIQRTDREVQIMKRNTYGSGSIEQQGPNRFRLTHYAGGKRHREWVNGARSDANRRLRELTARADAGEHVPASRVTLKTWTAEWITLLARGEASGMRRKGRVTPRTRERYHELLASYVLPALGDPAIQKLTPTQIDHVYIEREERLSPATVRHVHIALKACLATAVRKGFLVNNPAAKADAPRKVDPEVGRALSAEEVTRLLAGLANTPYYPI